MFKKALSLIICIIMLISSVIGSCIIVSADGKDVSSDTQAAPLADDGLGEASDIYGGSCSSNLTWTLDPSTGVLTISGIGSMENYDESYGTTYAPWASYASYIKSVVIEEGVTHMGAYAFVGCKNLESVSIPKSVESMGKLGFDNTPSLKSIHITDMEAWCNITRNGAALSNSFRNAEYDLYLNGELVTNVVIPDTVTAVKSHSFWQITSIKTLVIPDSVKSIGKSAFYDCKSLTDVVIGNSVTSISSYAFFNCVSLSSVTVPDSVKTIESYVFSIGSNGVNCIPNVNATIKCYQNSTAHTYAINKGLKYEFLCRHTFTAYTHFDATCDEDACEIAYCDKGCGASDIIKEEGTAYGHSFADYIYDNNATCLSDATKTAVCNTCGATDVRTVKGTALEHSYTNYEVTKELTCTENGIKEAYCDNGCGEKDVITEEAQGHIPSISTVLEEPTYYNEGCKVQYCTVCYELLNIEKLPVLVYEGFFDVWQNSWYAEGIEYCFKHGYVLGTDNGVFQPNAELTREQFVTILARIAGAELSKYTENTFDDVDADSWYGASVIWANSEGIVNGIGNGSFGVGDVLNREQLAAILCRYAEKQGIDTTETTDLSYCDDADDISEWALLPCAWAIKAKLLGSTSELANLLSPKMTVTRAQATKIFMSFDSIQ